MAGPPWCASAGRRATAAAAACRAQAGGRAGGRRAHVGVSVAVEQRGGVLDVEVLKL